MTKAELAVRNIHNAYDLAKTQEGAQVYIEYTGQGTYSASWAVHRVGFYTDSLNKCSKIFLVPSPRRDKEGRRLEAIAWATSRYSITEWERSPFGSYHPKGTIAKMAKVEAK